MQITHLNFDYRANNATKLLFFKDNIKPLRLFTNWPKPKSLRFPGNHAFDSNLTETNAATKLTLLLFALAALTSCLEGPKPFSQDGAGTQTYVTTTASNSQVTVSFSATSTSTQILKLTSISGLAGTALAIPSGALSKNSKSILPKVRQSSTVAR